MPAGGRDGGPSATPAGRGAPPAARAPGRGQRLLQAYYLATPLFVVLDLALGVNLRTSFLEEGPGLKFLYYGVAFACGLAGTRWPGRAALIGLVESGINIGWLVIDVMLQYLRVLDAAGAENALPAVPVTMPEVFNLILSAAVLTVSYTTAQAGLARDRG